MRSALGLWNETHPGHPRVAPRMHQHEADEGDRENEVDEDEGLEHRRVEDSTALPWVPMPRRLCSALFFAATAALLGAPGALAGHSPPTPPISSFARTLTFPHSQSAPQASKRVEVLSTVMPRGDANGNVWVHADHAYLGNFGTTRSTCESGVRVYDLRNPLRPRQVSTFAQPAVEPDMNGSYTDQIRIQHVRTGSFRGALAAVGIQGCRDPFNPFVGTRGFALYDVTRPAQPRRLAVVDTKPVWGSHELWLQAVGGRAYVFTALPRAELRGSPDGVTPGNPDFRIYDVTNPRAPRQVGQWGIWSNLGIKPTSDQYVHSVITNRAATRAYLSYWEFGTVILDISNPAAPRHVATLLDPTQVERPHAHSAWLAHGGKVLVETQEFGWFFRLSGTGYPRFWDISDETNPRLLGQFRPPGTEQSTVHDPKMAGNRLYLSWYDKGVYVLDFSRPEAPREIAHFVPGAGQNPGNPYCPGCTFVWEAFPNRDYFVAADMNFGLWIAKLECVVPRVRGMRLGAARAAIARSDCRTGRVTRARAGKSRRGRVLRQVPSPGSRPRFPSQVRLVVGR